MNKRLNSSLPDASSPSSIAKRSKLFDDVSMSTNVSVSSRFRRRFWPGPSPSLFSYSPSPKTTPSQPLALWSHEKRKAVPSCQRNMFTVPPRIGGISPAVASARPSSLDEYRTKIAGSYSATKKILLDLERVGAVRTPAANRSLSLFRNVTDRRNVTLLEGKRVSDGLSMADARSAVKYRTLGLLNDSQSSRDVFSTPQIRGSFKRFADHEPKLINTTNSQKTVEPAEDSGRVGLSPLPIVTTPTSKFEFSRPSPLSSSQTSPDAEEDITPTSVAQTVLPSNVDTAPGFILGDDPPKETFASEGHKFGLGETVLSDSSEKVELKKKPVELVVPAKFTSLSTPGGAVTSTATVPKSKPQEKSWNCTVCFISNPAEKNCCIACASQKPGAVAKPGWTCSTCFISNLADKVSCIACASLKTEASTKSNATVKSGWACTTCFVQNPGDKTSCMACASPKPDTAPKSNVGSKPGWCCGTCFIQNPAEKDSCVACASSKSQPSAVAKPEWSCTTCFVKNPADKAQCVACGSSNQSKAQNKEPKSNTNWTCSTCFITNPADKAQCSACAISKSGAESEPARTGQQKLGFPSVQFPIGTVSSSISSGQQKPVSTPFAFGLPQSTAPVAAGDVDEPDANATDSISVQSKPDEKSSISTGFTFGVTPAAPSTETAPVQQKPAFGASKPFTFGKPTAAVPIASFSQQQSGEKSQLSFGQVATNKNTSTSTFAFGLPKSVSGKTSGGETDAPTGLAFGTGGTGPDTISKSASSTSLFSFGQQTTAEVATNDEHEAGNASAQFSLGQQRTNGSSPPSFSSGQQKFGDSGTRTKVNGSQLSTSKFPLTASGELAPTTTAPSDLPVTASSTAGKSGGFGGPVPFAFGQQKSDQMASISTQSESQSSFLFGQQKPGPFSFGQLKSTETSTGNGENTNGTGTKSGFIFGKTNGDHQSTTSTLFGTSTGSTSSNAFAFGSSPASAQTNPAGGFKFTPETASSPNPFSVDNSSPAGRRQLTGKRKVKRP